MTGIDEKIAAWEHICRVYADYAATLDLACQRGCAACCTTNVVITGLEAWLIADYLDRQNRPDLFNAMRAAADEPRPQPRQTLNSLAAAWSRGEDPPAGDDPDMGRPCPLLTNNECPIYPARPFACRCLVSLSDCRGRGYARVEPFTITVGQVMQQYLEHVDLGGVTGNMLDLVPALENRARREQYAAGDITGFNGDFEINSPATVLLAGPEERQSLAPILAALNRTGEA